MPLSYTDVLRRMNAGPNNVSRGNLNTGVKAISAGIGNTRAPVYMGQMGEPFDQQPKRALSGNLNQEIKRPEYVPYTPFLQDMGDNVFGPRGNGGVNPGATPDMNAVQYSRAIAGQNPGIGTPVVGPTMDPMQTGGGIGGTKPMNAVMAAYGR